MAADLGDFPKTITISPNFSITIASPLAVGPGFGASPDNLSNFTIIEAGPLGSAEIVCGGSFPAFIVTSALNIIRNLAIPSCAIVVLIIGPPADGNHVHRLRIGSNATGPGPSPTTIGVAIVGGPDNNLVVGNLIANAFVGVGIAGAGTSGNHVVSNNIGTNADGSAS